MERTQSTAHAVYHIARHNAHTRLAGELAPLRTQIAVEVLPHGRRAASGWLIYSGFSRRQHDPATAAP
jgi:hypothetical protein